jgi:hypothetical protein
MNEAETRAELIEPRITAFGRGIVGVSCEIFARDK